MVLWYQVVAHIFSLLIGIVVGWYVGKKIGLMMPNAWVAAPVFAVGSLGGPAITYKLLGQGMWSFVVALFVCGFFAGLVLWPMGEKKGEREST